MRDTSRWKNKLVKEIKKLLPEDTDLNAGNFCDIELGLFLWFDLASTEDSWNFWTIITGWPFKNVWQKLSTSDKQAIAVARYYLRFYKSNRFWKKCLDSYLKIAEPVRLFNIDEKGILSRRELSLCPERIKTYKQVLKEMPVIKETNIEWAKPGTVYFHTPEESIDSVELPEELQVSSSENWQMNGNFTHKPIEATWGELEDTAYWMDEQLCTSFYKDQFAKIELNSVNKEWNFAEGISLNGLAHIVGMPSSGKSTLMKILAAWAGRKGLHTTLIVDNIASVLELAALMVDLGIEAAPILGAFNRREHLEKVHLLFSEEGLNLVNRTHLKWLSTVCPLNGLRKDTTVQRPFEPGREPCTALYDKNPWDSQTDKAKKYYCPLFEQCPVHETTRSLPKAKIWVATPASLIHTWIPAQLSGHKMRIWEAVYRQSDLLIIDEADRVQVVFDSFFAPTQVLADHTGKSWLNKLGESVSVSYYGGGRKQLANSSVMDWLKAYDNVQASINLIYSTLLKNSKLRKWIGRNYFTTWGLTDRLVIEWMDADPGIAGKELMNRMESFIINPFGQDTILEFVQAATLFLVAADSGMGRSLISKWLNSQGLSNLDEFTVDKLSMIVVFAVLEYSLYTMVEEWEEASQEFKLDNEGLDFFRHRLGDYQQVLPEAPMGNVMGFQYVQNDNINSPGIIRVFRFMGVGRWVMANFPYLLAEGDALTGPHTLLLSGTSWAPGSSAYHLSVTPVAILRAPESELKGIAGSEIMFDPVFDEQGKPIRVSGMKDNERITNLQLILKGLTDSGLRGKSRLQRELDLLNPERRRLLLLVGSYEEARIAKKFLENHRDWNSEDVCCLVRDDEEEQSENTIPRGMVEKFATRQAKILIAPMLAIERGHNILNEKNVAAFGSAFFLIRPMPVPHDMNNYTQYINHWAMRKYQDLEWLSRINPDGKLGDAGTQFRAKATKLWQFRLTNGHKNRSLSNWPPEEKQDLFWTQLVLIWQIIGRLIRGGCQARVHFCDAAFHMENSSEGCRVSEGSSMLLGIKKVLEPYFGQSTEIERSKIKNEDHQLAQALYEPLYQMLIKMKEI